MQNQREPPTESFDIQDSFIIDVSLSSLNDRLLWYMIKAQQHQVQTNFEGIAS